MAPRDVLLRLCRRAFLISMVQASGVLLLAHQSPYALATAFAINWMWVGNVRDGTDYRQPSIRWAYAIGATGGTAFALSVAWLLST